MVQIRVSPNFFHTPNKKKLPPVRLELTAFRLWDWRAAYCATEASLSWLFLFSLVWHWKQKNVSKIHCVGRESNPGQLLGRQLCSPLYHRRSHARCWHWKQHHVMSVQHFIVRRGLVGKTLPLIMTPWRNGSASDSRSEGCVFESRRGQYFWLLVRVKVSHQSKKNAVTRIRTWVTAATTQGPNH